MKESIRNNLKMIEDNIDNFNDLANRFAHKKEIKKYIAIWRWVVSHDYFNEKHPQPEFPASKPPLTWLNGELIGRSRPIYKDIATCIEPVVSSSLSTEHAARRIMQRLNMIYGYVTPEDAKKDQEAAYKRKVTDKLDAKKRAEYEQASRDKKKLKPPTEAEYKKAGEEYLKEKKAHRKKRHEELAAKKARSLKEFKDETRRLKRGN